MIGKFMKKNSKKIAWEDAIIKAIEECGGSATTKELYQRVPQIRANSLESSKANHIIRAFLRRMTHSSEKIKRIGLGIYALPHVQLQSNTSEIYDESNSDMPISESDIHSDLEGRLLELGNLYGYLTYTADPAKSFNGKKLRDISTVNDFPKFGTDALLNVAKKVDVIWFEKYSKSLTPKHTFDIEITTDFSRALSRAYQLRGYRTSFYLISKPEKYQQFQKRVALDPYNEIKDHLFFCPIQDIFLLYSAAIKHYEFKDKIIVEPK
jgi:hypothetical protein